jgi:hypothetical protein
MRPIYLLLVLFATHSTGALAQWIPVQAGDRVRIEAGSVSGLFNVIDMAADTLLLQADNTPSHIRVPLASVQQIARRDKRSGGQGALRGAGLGLLIGGASGAIVGFASGDDDPAQWFAFTAEEKALALGVVLGAGGALVGGIIGAISPGGRWVRVPLQSAPRVGLSSSAGVQIGYSIRL